MNKADGTSARERIGEVNCLAIQVYVLTHAVRALAQTHPDPTRFQLEFDRSMATMQVQSEFAGNLDHQLVVRDFVETVLFPPLPAG